MAQKVILDNKSLDEIDIGNGIVYYQNNTLYKDKNKTNQLLPVTSIENVTLNTLWNNYLAK